MGKLFFFLFLTPLFLTACVDSEYLREFSYSLQDQNYEECTRILSIWNRANPSVSAYAKGLEGAVSLAKGELEKSIQLIDESAIELMKQGVPEETIECILDWKEKAINFKEPSLNHVSLKSKSPPHVFLCKKQQPKGVKLKYWFGVAQIVAGCIAAPFSGGTSTALIMSGAAIVVSATSDSLNNMENWEQDLNRRQGMSTEKSSLRLPSRRRENQSFSVISA